MKIILLGNYFLHSNSAAIEYDQKSSTVRVSLNKKLIACPLSVNVIQANLASISDDHQSPNHDPLPSSPAMLESELLFPSQDQSNSEPDIFH